MNPVDPIASFHVADPKPRFLKGDSRGVVLKLWIVKGKSWLKGCGFGMIWDALSIPVGIVKKVSGACDLMC